MKKVSPAEAINKHKALSYAKHSSIINSLAITLTKRKYILIRKSGCFMQIRIVN
ncbi:hypothetical protein D3C72_624400 [compost metagenome]